jgi:hypothetical protein
LVNPEPDRKRSTIDIDQRIYTIAVLIIELIPITRMEGKMSDIFSMDYRACSAIGRSVCVRRAEVQCRSENHCVQPDCPLASEFSDAPVAPNSRAATSSIGLGWLAGRFNG